MDQLKAQFESLETGEFFKYYYSLITVNFQNCGGTEVPTYLTA